jgi:hypothetical protein
MDAFAKIPAGQRVEEPLGLVEQEPAVEGYLDKMTKGKMLKFTRWHRRYFKLKGSRLVYYETKFDREVKGQLELRGLVKSCMRDVNDRTTLIIRFLDAKAEPLTLRADHDHEAQKWADELQAFVPTALPTDAVADISLGGGAAAAAAGAGGGVPFADYERIFATKRRASVSGIRAGYLWKRALKSGRNWKRRYFILTDDKISYHVDEFSAAKPKGEIALCGGCSVCEGTGDTANSLVLTTPETKLFAAAETRAELVAWMAALNTKIARLGGSGLAATPVGGAIPLSAVAAPGAGSSDGGAALPSSIEELFHAGLLRKRAIESGRNWKKRYFVLTGDTLVYFASEYKTDRPKGALLIDGRTTVRSFVPKAVIELQHIFVIETDDPEAEVPEGQAAGPVRKKMYAAAESREAQQLWIAMIQRSVDFANGVDIGASPGAEVARAMGMGAAARPAVPTPRAVALPAAAAPAPKPFDPTSPFDIATPPKVQSPPRAGAPAPVPAPALAATFGALAADASRVIPAPGSAAQLQQQQQQQRKLPPLPADLGSLTEKELQFHLAVRRVAFRHLTTRAELLALLARTVAAERSGGGGGGGGGVAAGGAGAVAGGGARRAHRTENAVQQRGEGSGSAAANKAALLATIARFKAKQVEQRHEQARAQALRAQAPPLRTAIAAQKAAAVAAAAAAAAVAPPLPPVAQATGGSWQADDSSDDGDDDDDEEEGNFELEPGVFKAYVGGDPTSKLPEAVGIRLGDFGVSLTEGVPGGATLLFWPWLPVGIATAKQLPTVRGWRAKLQSQDPDDMELLLTEVSGLGVFSFELNDAHAMLALVDAQRKSRVQSDEDWPTPPSSWVLAGLQAASGGAQRKGLELALPSSPDAADDEMAGFW